jgi:NADPH-dependent glutamate synthase beta subunit-like oxidoreductase/coenzyme F420-reducing hydrogenase delta subunit/NAD-dependent dihydropyrimidine dehydrogenase PreA subunit
MSLMTKGVSVIGSGISAAQAALTLAELGINVSLITPNPSLDLNGSEDHVHSVPSHESLHLWPLLLKATSHPKIKLYTNTRVESITGKSGKWSIKASKKPRYVSEELCTGCGKCEAECSVQVTDQSNGQKVIHSAIHAPVPGLKTVPSAYCIEKRGISPCRANCPLGINIQGYIALIAKGKIDKACALINEVAPMAGILGRLCTHPCETNCAREKVDNSVYIQALHRYAADHATAGIVYSRKAPAGSRKEKIAIIGSGPAGLTAAWELARRGYNPTVFESHAVVGGMLATGIPRFRLPREVREREVEAIRALGVDIKTGVTVGSDITYSELLENGYKAFFLAIGAQQNNRLNIPGEELEDVFDSISLLFSLNLKVGATLGPNVVVIGGGNSAVDSARSAKRASKGNVRILCITEAMTAVKDETDEAVKEGIRIDYNVSPIEILSESGKVTGIRCQKVQNVTFGPSGQVNVEYVPGSDFVVPADHVVVSIGQRPNSTMLNIKSLKINNNSTLKIEPLTLETDIPGVFAGGDAVTGSNNVVEAVAAGLRAAESMDRYLKGHDLKKGRTLERPIPVEVDIQERKASPHKRAQMPALPVSKRKSSYEETSLGLPGDIAGREAGRCLNCAICCECLECEAACELKAISHTDTVRPIEIEAERVINFVSASPDIREFNKPGIYNIVKNHTGTLPGELARASSVALSLAIEIKAAQSKTKITPALSLPARTDTQAQPSPQLDCNRTAVFLCRCGDSISSILDFYSIKNEISELPGVYSVQELAQACTSEGSRQIREYVEKEKAGHVVLAACRCCNLEQICFSCSDRRVKCQNNLTVDLPKGANIEFTNIREQCAWVHTDDPAGATEKAAGLIKTSVVRAQKLQPVIHELRPVVSSALVLGTGLSGLAAARSLAEQGYRVILAYYLESLNSVRQSPEYQENIEKLLQQLSSQGTRVYPWPQQMELNGTPGRYEVRIPLDSEVSDLQVGVVVLDLTNTNENIQRILSRSNLLHRVISRQNYDSRVSSLDRTITHSCTVRETAGIFIIVPNGADTVEEFITRGEATAARASAYLDQPTFKPRSSSVIIDNKLCRGCGDCARLCTYIDIKTNSVGVASATIDPALCFGCGACISVCPTGAIVQPLQSDVGLSAALESQKPSVVVFACNWDGLSCIEDAGQKHLSFPSWVRVVRVSCLSRVHTGLILKAFELGANGVMLLGCDPRSCHFGIDEALVNQNYAKAQSIMRLLGLDRDRLVLERLPHGDGAAFIKKVTGFAGQIGEIF